MEAWAGSLHGMEVAAAPPGRKPAIIEIETAQLAAGFGLRGAAWAKRQRRIMPLRISRSMALRSLDPVRRMISLTIAGEIRWRLAR